MRTRMLIKVVAGGLFLLGGCAVAPAPTAVERDYGLSYHLAVYDQIAHPAAEENLLWVEGIDGKAALGAYSKYQESFSHAAAPAPSSASTSIAVGR